MEANYVFYEVSRPTIYTWNAIISAHVKLGKCEGALALYEKMQQEGTKPAKVTFLFVLKACASMQAPGLGQRIHDQIVESGLHADVVVGSTLVDMYCKCGNLEDAYRVFDGLPNRNAVSWGAMFAGYVQSGHALLALKHFETMQHEDTEPNGHTFSCILKACGTVGARQQGKILHNEIIKCGFESDLVIENTLVDMYAKCGGLDEARKMFDALPKSNVVSWGVMISGYVQHGEGLLALELFHQLQQMEDVKVSKSTFSCTLKACGMVEAIDQGRLLHEWIIVDGLQSDVVIGNALIDMYAKCGKLEEACKVFDLLLHKNVVTWGTIISGYAQHGQGTLALVLFEEMQEQGIMPDEVIFMCVLKACASATSIGLGQKIHDQIIKIQFNGGDDIQKSLVDMYVKCARLEEAQRVFDSVLNKDVVLWSVMIGGYAQHGHCLSALKLFIRMQEVSTKPDKFIFSCALKACSAIGAIGHGRWIHNQVVRNGLETDVVVGTALVDMYTCCESLGEACRVFGRLPNRNEVSWGAIIAGHAQIGNCRKAREFLEIMQEQGLKPNDVIMTSVLAACSHAGLLEEGFGYFDFMQKNHSWVPSIAEYSCMVDLLGRTGCFIEAKDLMETIPMQPDGFAWASLLTGCRTYGKSEFARECFDGLVGLNPKEASGYVMMSNVFAAEEMWDDVDKMKDLRNCLGAQKKLGTTWIEIDNGMHEFIVGDTRHPESEMIEAKLRRLSIQVKKKGHLPKMDLVLDEKHMLRAKGGMLMAL